MTSPSSQITSHPVSVFTDVSTSGQQVFHNGRQDAVFVCTFLQLINKSANSGDAIVIGDDLTSVGIHSGSVGAGSYDRFPLACQVTVLAGRRLLVLALGGDWWVTVSGYYTPHLLDQ